MVCHKTTMPNVFSNSSRGKHQFSVSIQYKKKVVLKVSSQEKPQRFPKEQQKSKNEIQNQKWFKKCNRTTESFWYKKGPFGLFKISSNHL